MANPDKTAPDQLVVVKGPWPFVTHRHIRSAGRPDRIWQSRPHRKNLPDVPGLGGADLWQMLARAIRNTHSLNWWIGVLFAIGSVLFMTGSVLTLAPLLASFLSVKAAAIGLIFFAGSLPFTSAAFLQLYQAATAPPPDAVDQPRQGGLFAWRWQNIGWLGCALQFAGTLLFNINTFDAMWPDLDRVHYDLVIWVPDIFGSGLFLASGYLAFIEVGHKYLSWQPGNISWLVTSINLFGCVAFMISAVFAFEPTRPFGFDAAGISVALTLLGAAAFLIGSLLMLPEGVE